MLNDFPAFLGPQAADCATLSLEVPQIASSGGMPAPWRARNCMSSGLLTVAWVFITADLPVNLHTEFMIICPFRLLLMHL